jgi:hypothetical protein
VRGLLNVGVGVVELAFGASEVSVARRGVKEENERAVDGVERKADRARRQRRQIMLRYVVVRLGEVHLRFGLFRGLYGGRILPKRKEYHIYVCTIKLEAYG